jgi:hypothetical protein
MIPGMMWNSHVVGEVCSQVVAAQGSNRVHRLVLVERLIGLTDRVVVPDEELVRRRRRAVGELEAERVHPGCVEHPAALGRA